MNIFEGDSGLVKITINREPSPRQLYQKGAQIFLESVNTPNLVVGLKNVSTKCPSDTAEVPWAFHLNRGLNQEIAMAMADLT